MKKLVLSLLACGSIAAANAQTGSWLMYGSLNLALNTDKQIVTGPSVDVEDKTNSSSLQFNPGVGMNINNNWTIGLELGIGVNHTKFTPDDTGAADVDDRGFDLAVGPFVRYTKNVGDHFFTFTQANVSFLTGRTKHEVTPSTFDPVNKYSGFRMGIAPAVGIKIKPCMSLAVGFGGIEYQYVNFDNTEGDFGPTPGGFESRNKQSDFMITFGQEVNLTVQWHFGGTKTHGHHQPMDDTRDINTSDDDDDNNRKKRHSNDDE